MKRIISYSLYGNNPLYLIGAIRNAEDVSVFFPGWQARFYVGSSIAPEIQEKLLELGAEVVPLSGREDASAMFWRFKVFCDPEVEWTIIRDSDSRLSLRESAAVSEWLASGKDFHIMRDHPAHNCAILGGLWGARTAALRHFCEMLEKVEPEGRYGEDQEFLHKHVYQLARRSSLVHDSFFSRESWSAPFPTKREGLAFVGEIFDENGLPRQADREIIAKTIGSTYYRVRLWLGSFLRRVFGS